LLEISVKFIFQDACAHPLWTCLKKAKLK
jgi:hypothetical protein